MKLSIKNFETGTTPCIIHGNGASKKSTLPWYGPWDDVIKCHCNYDKFEKKLLRKDLTIVSWKGGKYANKETPLEISCRKFGIPIYIMNWYPVTNFWVETKKRLIDTAEEIRSGRINTKYIMALDCGDTYLFKHPNDIIEIFLETFGEYGTVWNAETNDWPHNKLPKYKSHIAIDEPLKEVSIYDQQQKKIQNSRFVHLNGGGVIGRCDSLLEFYDYANSTFKFVDTVDQAMGRITQYRFKNIHTLDYQCKIFQTLYNVNRKQFQCEINE